ncbi:hypothetical protein F5Y15DRAFT_366955 [Xylariaceae sp. FL0016]|nr:hypothetical protein F5Y15DRAFT_366955 [Xylariaceae sp. FL0016]
MVPCVYFFYPETAYRSLEEMDEIFHRTHGLKGCFDVVHISNTMPKRYGKKGESLVNYNDTEEARQVAERRRSSAVGVPTEKAQEESQPTVTHNDETLLDSPRRTY